MNNVWGYGKEWKITMKIVKYALMGGWMYHEGSKQWEEAIASWGGELPKCAQPNSTMETDVKASLVGDGNCWNEVFKKGDSRVKGGKGTKNLC